MGRALVLLWILAPRGMDIGCSIDGQREYCVGLQEGTYTWLETVQPVDALRDSDASANVCSQAKQRAVKG